MKMRPLLVRVLVLIGLFSAEASAEFASEVQKLIQHSGLNSSAFGILIQSAETGATPLFSLQPDKKLIPASITKVVTSAMVLEKMPPGTKIKTQLLSSGGVENGVLKGSLYLKGGGDPSFVSENMWYLVNVFTRQKIREIQGDIIVDDSLFDRERFDASRQEERVDRAYDAPTGAMSFNWNSVNVFVRPGNKVGQPALVFADPENEFIDLEADVKTVSGSGHQVSIERKQHKESEEATKHDVIIVRGHIGVESDEVVTYKNITRPDLWAGANLRSFLAQRGIAVKGHVRNGVTPNNADLRAESESKGVEQILADMNKFSNNFVAEMLAKGAAAKTAPPGTIAGAMKLASEHLVRLGNKADDFDLQNPSGLTRENQITAKTLWSVLKEFHQDFRFQAEFQTSLPIAGIDGTLKKRMKNSVAERWVRAKTGFLTGVVSLAGYAGQPQGKVVPFVMMYNGGGDEAKVRALYDQICELLVREIGGGT